MKKMLAAFMSLLALAGVARAGEVPDGSVWVGGGSTVTVDISVNVTANDVTVTVTDGEGTSNPVTGTPGPNSTAADPTVTETPGGGDEGSPMTTPGEDGKSYRAHNGKMQYKGEDGTWKNMRKKRTQSNQMERLVVGQPAPRDGWLAALDFSRRVHLVQGEVAPYTGWWIGDEVTSLPGPIPD
jgi:flagellar hook assembly protein FlgD